LLKCLRYLSVIDILALDRNKVKIFTTTTSRPNLHYDVQYYSEDDDVRLQRFVDWIRTIYIRRLENPTRNTDLKNKGERVTSVSGIIYTSTRGSCDELAKELRKEGIGAVAYHAGLTQQDRLDYQSRWLSNTPGYDIIVATTAFGMGIDKDNVRFVVHWNLPKSFEGFYQEAGRAGRDGRASLCTIFYSHEDCQRTAYRVKEPNDKKSGGVPTSIGLESSQAEKSKSRFVSFQKLVDYCETVNICRHQMISEYFGEHTTSSTCNLACDICKESGEVGKRKESGLSTDN
jgi:superfamily II DNA helicase RecQ